MALKRLRRSLAYAIIIRLGRLNYFQLHNNFNQGAGQDFLLAENRIPKKRQWMESCAPLSQSRFPELFRGGKFRCARMCDIDSKFCLGFCAKPRLPCQEPCCDVVWKGDWEECGCAHIIIVIHFWLELQSNEIAESRLAWHRLIYIRERVVGSPSSRNSWGWWFSGGWNGAFSRRGLQLITGSCDRNLNRTAELCSRGFWGEERSVVWGEMLWKGRTVERLMKINFCSNRWNLQLVT